MLESRSSEASDRGAPAVATAAEATGAEPRARSLGLADAPAQHTLADGAVVTVSGGAAEIRDAHGMLLVRYENGAATIAAPDGNLTLLAPKGRVVMRAGSDVEIEAAGAIRQRATAAVSLASEGPEGRAALSLDRGSSALDAERLAVRTHSAELVTSAATLVAHTLATTAERVAAKVERYELTAGRIVEKARDSLREVSELAQSRVGRLRMLVSDLYTLESRRTVMVSQDDTSIDGKRVLLG